MKDNKYWADVNINTIPNMVTEAPGPKSREIEKRASKYMKGYSSQAQLFPVAFESGKGYTLTDVDGNTYIDFSSGIYITNFGHCHPKITEALVKEVRKLQNCHDFNTEIKTRLLEKIAEIVPGDLHGYQLWCEGSKAVEAGLNVARAATGKFEFISFYNAMHGKTQGAASLKQMEPYNGQRVSGSIIAPFGHCYHCSYKLKHPDCGIHCVEHLREVIKQQSTQMVAAIISEPIQGWGGSIVPPDEFWPKLRQLCDELGILLFADEVLTCLGRTGKWFAVEHWNVKPDIITIGKGFANGFPMTATLFSDKFKDRMEHVSAGSSYGGNPMACAAALASIEVCEEENLLEHATVLGDHILKKLKQIQGRHKIIGEVRGKGCLLGMELVKDLNTREPFTAAGRMVYQKAFAKGLAWIPSGHNLRMSPPLIMPEEVADKALDIIEQALDETERHFGY